MIFYTRKYDKGRYPYGPDSFPGFYLDPSGQVCNLPETMGNAMKDEMQGYMVERFGEAEYIGPASFDELVRQAPSILTSVEAGTRLLDDLEPEWEARVDLAKLDLARHGTCLLSQIFGSYEEGIQRLGIGPMLIEAAFLESICWDNYGGEFGFTVPSSVRPGTAKNGFAWLTDVWRRRITQRRAEKATAKQIA